MTKKDYELIAMSLKESRVGDIGVDAAVSRVAYKLAHVFKLANPRFSPERFLAACGVPEGEINQ